MAVPPTSSTSSLRSISGSSLERRLVCPKCGLTAQELHDGGKMGCAVCYDTFSDMVWQAAIELHGVTNVGPPAIPPSLPPDRDASPWPTRKAVPVRSAHS